MTDLRSHLLGSVAAAAAIPTISDLDAALNENQAAAVLNVSVRTLQAWRVRGGGPPYIKLSRAVRYSHRALRIYQQEHTFTSTTEADAKEPLR
jgi:hypothetical protein